MHLSSVLRVASTAGVVVAGSTMVIAPQTVVGALTSAHTPTVVTTAPAASRPSTSTVQDGSTGTRATPRTQVPTGTPAPKASSTPPPPPPAPPPAGDGTSMDVSRPDPKQVDRQLSLVQVPPRLVNRVRQEVQTTVDASGTDEPVTFGLASSNVLGSNHTSPGGDKSFFAPGTLRMEWEVSYLRNVPSDIIGFQETQRDQLATFMRATGNTYDAWPGEQLGAGGVPQTMVWRTDLFTAVEKRYITIPFLGQRRKQPVVLLRHNQTGREFWVINAHNAPRDRFAERAQAQALEISTINELRRTGLPVLFVGDMNDKEKIFCGVTGQTDLYSPLGGSNDGTCRPPRGMRVDWMFGSAGVQFDGFRDDKNPALRRATDHAVLLAQVTLP